MINGLELLDGDGLSADLCEELKFNCGPRGGTQGAEPGSGLQRFWDLLGASEFDPSFQQLGVSETPSQGPLRAIALQTETDTEKRNRLCAMPPPSTLCTFMVASLCLTRLPHAAPNPS